MKFPICARCTGEFLGIIIALFTFWLFCPNAALLLLMLVPLIVDGIIQLLCKYESTNRRRLATGILFGYALLELFFISVTAAFQYGFKLGLRK